MPPTPEPDLWDRVTRSGTFGIAFVTLVWGIGRFALRPLLDVLVLESWKRKGSDAERFMREGMFADDLKAMTELQRVADLALRQESKNAADIRELLDLRRVDIQEAKAQGALLAGIPHLVSTVDEMREEMREEVRELSRAARANGEGVASALAMLTSHADLLASLVGTDRRREARRVSDAPYHHPGEGG